MVMRMEIKEREEKGRGGREGNMEENMMVREGEMSGKFEIMKMEGEKR